MSDIEVTFHDILLHLEDTFLLWVCSPQQIFILQMSLLNMQADFFRCRALVAMLKSHVLQWSK